MARHIVIVEDEIALAHNYRDALTRQGFTVSLYHNRADALTAFHQQLPDLAIIDVGLGEDIEGGFDLCRELRARAPMLPIIFLTARDSEFDVVSGLRLGADDYLTKDISETHMLARIIALFRRVEALRNPHQTPQEDILERKQLTLNMDRMSAHWKSEPIDLTITELWIVYALAKHPGHVKNRQQLMDAAKVVLDDNTITSHIKRIRKKFLAVDQKFDAIKTAYGMGYRWDLTQ